MQIASEVVPRTRQTTPLGFSRPLLAVLLSWGFCVGSLPAHAARAVDEVSRLLDQGNAREAAKQADSYLKQNPGDVEMRFLRGVVATEQKNNAQAIKIFSALVREYPAMPEPYNNLAVLYAAEGQERKAAEALEQAIRTNPSYTTAHENLGDLYARMASEAYSKALQLDSSRETIPAKLALITQLVPGQQQEQAKTVVAQAGAPAATAPAAPKSSPTQLPPKPERKPAPAEIKAPVETKAATKSAAAPAPAVAPVPAAAAPAAPKPVAPPPAAPAVAPAPVAAAPKPVAPQPAVPAVAPAPAAPQPATSQPAPAPRAQPAADEKPVVAAKAEESAAIAEIESAVKDWAAAWQKQDMTRYLNAYSAKFEPANGAGLAQWKEARRVRIVGKNNIAVTLQNLQVSVDGNRATAKFRQHYVAGSLKTTTRKTLALRHEGGHWRIVRESTGG